MRVRRRTLLIGSALTAGASLLPHADITAAAAPAPRRPAFRRLPPGAVGPRDWPATQLTGLCGRYQEISGFLRFDTSAWVHPDRDGGEELPCWLPGYGDLGYATGDPRVLTETERRAEAVLATAASNGFGPIRPRNGLNGHADLWPHMPMQHAPRSWAEYHNGARDRLWRLRADIGGSWRIQNVNSGTVLGVDRMSYADSAQVVQFADNGTADHVWRLL